MSEHHTKNTTGTMAFCKTCNRVTLHRVSDRRLGPCTEVHVTGLSKVQQKRKEEREAAEEQPELF